MVVAWAKLENSINDLVWVINGKTLATGRFDTQDLDITKLLSALQKAISTSMPGQSLQNERKVATNILDSVNEHKSDRNAVVHGTWGEYAGNPGVCSLRFERMSDDVVTFECFPSDRMIALEKVALDATKNTYALIERLEALQKKHAQRPPRDESNRP